MSSEGLEQVMQAAGTGVVMVVLNACFSEVQTQALVARPLDLVRAALDDRVRCRGARREGPELHAAGKLVAALASYGSSWKCKRDPNTAHRGFIIACNIPSLQKAKMFWKRLPADVKPNVVASWVDNQISEKEIDGP